MSLRYYLRNKKEKIFIVKVTGKYKKDYKQHNSLSPNKNISTLSLLRRFDFFILTKGLDFLLPH